MECDQPSDRVSEARDYLDELVLSLKPIQYFLNKAALHQGFRYYLKNHQRRL